MIQSKYSLQKFYNNKIYSEKYFLDIDEIVNMNHVAINPDATFQEKKVDINIDNNVIGEFEPIKFEGMWVKLYDTPELPEYYVDIVSEINKIDDRVNIDDILNIIDTKKLKKGRKSFYSEDYSLNELRNFARSLGIRTRSKKEIIENIILLKKQRGLL